MLERASACVEPRLWCSRTARKHASRSSRLLHSAFWCHGAGSFELPPHALRPVHDYNLTNASAPTVSKEKNSLVYSEAPFLDFLYPPQTLALLQRQNREDGRRRMQQGHRKYSSSPLRLSELRLSAKQASSDVYTSTAGQVHQATRTRDGGLPETDGHANQVTQDTSLDKAISEATLDEAGLGRVRALYKYMPEASKESLHVKQSLIVWLESLPRIRKARTWQQKLLEQMPPEDRLGESLWSPAYCRIAVAHHLRVRDVSRAHAILRGALERRMEGDYGARRLLRHLVEKHKWLNASRLLYNVRQNAQGAKSWEVMHSALEGLSSGQMQQHLSHLLEHLPQGRNELEVVMVQSLVAALINHLVVPLSDGRQSFVQYQRRSRELSDFLNRLPNNSEASALYEPVIAQLLQVTKPREKLRHGKLIADVWTRYSQTPMFKPSKDTMIRLLQAWNEGSLPNHVASTSRRPAFSPATVQEAWELTHGHLDHVPRTILMGINAQIGEVGEVEELAKGYMDSLGDNKVNADFFWPYIQVHGVRRDAKAALAAFKRLSTTFDVTPDAKSWDMLQYAYMRADDLAGAVQTFEQRMDSGISLTAQSLTTLMVLYSKLGDSDGILSLLKLAEVNSIPVNTHMQNALLLSHANAGQVGEAMDVLRRTVEDHKDGKVEGSLTRIFNSAMSVRARRREYVEFLKIYEQMRREGITLNSESYSAIMTALVMRRNTDEAWWTLRKVLPEENIEATPFQYATVMSGFVRVGNFDEALNVWDHMQKHGVEPTVSTRAAFLKAKAMQENKSKANDVLEDDVEVESEPLDDTMRALLEALEQDQKFDRSSEFGMRNVSSSDAESSLFESLIFLHGRRRCFDVAWKLFQIHNERRKKAHGMEDDSMAPAFRMTTAMMSVYNNAGQHEEVLNCWNILLDQATTLAKVQYPKIPTDPLAFDGGDKPLLDSSASIAPARRFLLSEPFRLYAASVLTSPSVTAESTNALISTLMSLLSAGWSFDNITWNTLIQKLCGMSPSRALFAFTLTERFLIPQFPGWQYPRRSFTNTYGRPSLRKTAEQVQYMNYPQRYVAPGDRLPFYRTMVWLAYALLELRRIESAGLGAGGEQKALRAQIGSLKEITKRAPHTLEHVRNLPIVLDPIQQQLIQRGDDVTQGGRWFGQV